MIFFKKPFAIIRDQSRKFKNSRKTSKLLSVILFFIFPYFERPIFAMSFVVDFFLVKGRQLNELEVINLNLKHHLNNSLTLIRPYFQDWNFGLSTRLVTIGWTWGQWHNSDQIRRFLTVMTWPYWSICESIIWISCSWDCSQWNHSRYSKARSDRSKRRIH